MLVISVYDATINITNQHARTLFIALYIALHIRLQIEVPEIWMPIWVPATSSNLHRANNNYKLYAVEQDDWVSRLKKNKYSTTEATVAAKYPETEIECFDDIVEFPREISNHRCTHGMCLLLAYDLDARI